VEAVLFSPLGSGAALVPDGAAVLIEGASGEVVVLAIEGAAAAAPVVSGVPPALGGSVVLGAAAAPRADCASVDTRSSSSPAARGGVVGVAVAARSGPGVVCPVFLFFLLFFSSFFSSASLKRKGGNEVRGKVRQEVNVFVQEHSRGVLLHPSSFAREGRGWWRGRGRFAHRFLPMGGPSLGLPAGAFVVKLGAALCLQAGSVPLLLQVSRGGHVGVSPGGLVRQGGIVVGGI
jgi:hypothetical protein